MKSKKANIVKIATGMLFIFVGNAAWAQGERALIKEGNDAYKKADYPAATGSYAKVVQKNPTNATAQYNLGNALYKTEKTEEAIAAYDRSLAQLTKPVEKSNAFYNKGVVLHNNKKILECIIAYKEALKLDPNNEDARQNLQKALKQQKEEEKKDKDKKDKDKDEDQKNKDQQQQPKPQQSRITKKDAEEKLKALLQKEKNLQDKLRKVSSSSPDKPEKDW